MARVILIILSTLPWAGGAELARPSEEAQRQARATLEALPEQDLARVRLWRQVLACEADTRRLPAWRRPTEVSPLGWSKGVDGGGLGGGMEAATLLRLAAMARTGYPAEEDLLGELSTYLHTPLPDVEAGAARLTLELITLEALRGRMEVDGDVSLLAHQVVERQVRVARLLPWSDTKLEAVPRSPAHLARLIQELVCRRIVKRRRLPVTMTGRWDSFLRAICKCLHRHGRGEGWRLLTRGTPAERERTRVLLLVLLSLASEDVQLEEQDQTLQGAFAEGLGLLEETTLQALNQRDTLWIFEGDSTALTTLLRADLVTEELRPVRQQVAARAMPVVSDMVASPRVDHMGFAELGGWDLFTTTPQRPQSLWELDEHAATCLTLLGASGGLICDTPPLPTMPSERLSLALDAFTTLELAQVPEDLEARVDRGLQRAAHWLQGQQRPEGSFPGTYSFGMGGHALALLALLHAGVSPEDESISRGLAHLSTLNVHQAEHDGPTYSYALALLVLQRFHEKVQHQAGALSARTPEEYLAATRRVWDQLPEAHQRMVQLSVQSLTDGARGRGWSYQGPSRRVQVRTYDARSPGWSDNSNSHFAVLGLRAASLLGVDIPRRLLVEEASRLVHEYVPDRTMRKIKVPTGGRRQPRGREDQIQPGGWRYSQFREFNTSPPTVAMTADGIASLLVIREELELLGLLRGSELERLDLALGGASSWLNRRLTYPRSLRRRALDPVEGQGRFYEMCAMARACALHEQEHLGGEEWYPRICDLLLRHQSADGSWPDLLPFSGIRLVDHCFAMLVLSRTPLPIRRPPIPATTEEE